MSITVFGNDGNEDGFSFQCMLISILDYFRKKTTILPTMTLKQFRKDNNITPERWGTKSEFDNTNPEMVKILQELTNKYKLNIYLRNENTNSNGIVYLSPPERIHGLNYMVAFTDIYIKKYPGHFELLNEDTITTQEDYIYIPMKINIPDEVAKIRQESAINKQLIITSKGNIKFYRIQLDQQYNEIIQFLSGIKGPINAMMEGTITNFNVDINKYKQLIKSNAIDTWFTYNCKGSTSKYTSNTEYSDDTRILILASYNAFMESKLSNETIRIMEGNKIHNITFTKDPHQANGKNCLLLKY